MHDINDSPDMPSSQEASACLMYYLSCIQKIAKSQELNIDLSNKQNIFAFSYIHSPDLYLQEKTLIFIESKEHHEVMDKYGHYFCENVKVELDEDFNCRRITKPCLFITFDWLERFYVKPLQKLSEEIEKSLFLK